MASSSQPASVERLIRSRADDLTPAERRVAALVLDDLESVAFGTVAQVAARAGVSGPTVVRLAAHLGFEGYVGLQAAAQADLSARLRAGGEMRAPATDPLPATLENGLDNLRSTVERQDAKVFAKVTQLVADPDRKVWVLPGERLKAPALVLNACLLAMREGVRLLDGSPYHIGLWLAAVDRGDVLVVLDATPAERWLVDTVALATERKPVVVSLLADGLNGVAAHSHHVLPFASRAASPFGSLVAAMALVEALAFAVGLALHEPTARRARDLESFRARARLLEGP